MNSRLYVLAFTDRAIRRNRRGQAVLNIEVSGIFAVCRRCSTIPAPTDDTLRRQHREVINLARHAPAILPVRFGALVERDELVKLMRRHHDSLRRALDEVRDRVQMTVRVLGTAPLREPPRSSSGRDYLERRRRALEPELPAEAGALVSAVRRFAVRERLEPGAAGLLATIYHLVAAADVDAYAAVAAQAASARALVSGPWPPFAFAPQLW